MSALEELDLESRMEMIHRQHREDEIRINAKIDAEIEKYIDNPILGVQFKSPFLSRPSNPSLFFIVPNEFAERFCYYGFSPLLKNLFGQVLGLTTHSYGMDGKLTGESNNSAVNQLKLNFDFATYFTPILGAIVSDSFLDKYKTIMLFSSLYMVGMYLLSFGTNPHILGFSQVFAPITSATPMNDTVAQSGVQFIAEANVSHVNPSIIYSALVLLALGTGGIKACVSAHGGDQFLEKQTWGLNQFYSIFYIAINTGAMISGFVTPNVKKQNCFGVEGDCYSNAFFICAAVFTFAYIIFGIGVRYYRVVPPAGRFIIWDLLCAGFTRLFRGEEYAQSVYGKALLVEAADLAKVLIAILPTPIFWMGFNQNSNVWQDSTDRLGVSVMNSETLNSVVNPIFIVLLAPIFNAYIYPLIPKKYGLLHRMCVGYLFAAVSFIACALIENYVEDRCTIDKTLQKNDYYFGKCAYPQLDNLIWAIPYFLITCGEVLVSISGLNFMYEEVGKRTKSSSLALWLLTSSLGSFIAGRLLKIVDPTLKSEGGNSYVYFYYLCAGIIMGAFVLQCILAWFYVPKAQRVGNDVENVEIEKEKA
ncbi:hypothetical protein HDV01_001573 [Terramyces sp. JEL0728]|nr:hypothetical protein HDV01_001573 [Terramyces sp. JEL0728]